MQHIRRWIGSRTVVASSVVAVIIVLMLAPPERGHVVNAIIIGVIAELEAVGGSSISQAAELAADEINAAGGVGGRQVEIITYDSHSSAAEAVRVFKRAFRDHVTAVIASNISDVVLALQPWSGRLKTVLVTPGASSDVITLNIGRDYPHLRYTFQGYPTSSGLGRLVCAAAKDILVDGLHMKTAVIVSEGASSTAALNVNYETCLPEIGIKVLDHIHLSSDTTDFTAMFNKIESLKPAVIITTVARAGLQPPVRWQQQEVRIPMFGIAAQASNYGFWSDTNRTTEGLLYQGVAGPDIAITPKTLPFVTAFKAKFGTFPSFAGYTAHDEVYYIAEAIKRTGGWTDPDTLVEELEKTDYVGTIGRVQFTGKDSPAPHAVKIGAGAVTGVLFQWQEGKQVNLWPAEVANGKPRFANFSTSSLVGEYERSGETKGSRDE